MPRPDPRLPALIVSGNADIADLYVLSLRNERTGILSAASASEALQLLRDRSVCAVVVDIARPPEDWETCRQLVAEAGALPVIVLTGWIDEAAVDRAFALGCAAFIAKPASPESLREVLRRAGAGERGIVVMG